MNSSYRKRRIVIAIVVFIISVTAIFLHPEFQQAPAPTSQNQSVSSEAATVLNELEVKGRAPKTGYTRDQFGGGWASVRGCDTRNIILHRDLTNVVENEKCQVISGMLADPYTGSTIQFTRGGGTSDAVQIDHVVALSDAWQKGAQQLTPERRQALANDPLELLATDGPANQQKSDGDAATWLPPNKAFRCQYVARQIVVKKKYSLWVTAAEKEAIARVLDSCPGQKLPIEQ
jgi:hypothetical protein